MVEENHKTIPRTCDEALLDEDTRQHRTKDTTSAVCGEHVEGVVNL